MRKIKLTQPTKKSAVAPARKMRRPKRLRFNPDAVIHQGVLSRDFAC